MHKYPSLALQFPTHKITQTHHKATHNEITAAGNNAEIITYINATVALLFQLLITKHLLTDRKKSSTIRSTNKELLIKPDTLVPTFSYCLVCFSFARLWCCHAVPLLPLCWALLLMLGAALGASTRFIDRTKTRN